MTFAYTAGKFGKFFYYRPDAIGQRIASGVFHDEHLQTYLDSLTPDDVFVDVGANIGFLSIYAARQGAKVEAFEADVDLYELMKQNVFENNFLDKIHTRNVALYDSHTKLVVNPKWTDYTKRDNGSIDWEHSPNSGGLSLVKSEGPYQPRTTYYLSRMLDDFCLDKVTLLKTDTQGSDLRVLVGAMDTIKRCQPAIIFEFEHDGSGKNAAGDSLPDFIDFLDGLKYHAFPICPETNGWQDFFSEPNR